VGLRPDGLPDIEWVEIPAGPFIMGSKKGETDYDNETPQMKDCTLIWQPYRISRYQVTVAQYQAFVETGGYRQERFWQWSAEALAWFRENQGAGPASNSQVFLTPNSPRVGVNWFEAVAFCHWLSERTGQSITLPTEAQWERAARHTDGRAYPWGNSAADLAQRCNMWDTGIGHTSAVGLFPSGKAECGACDLSGNVWEWCRTKWRGDYVNYQTKVDDGLSGEDACVARGGSWITGDVGRLSSSCRRISYRPGLRYSYFGFRVVCLVVAVR
jgi:formylglycine-generating enzyme required for sulfatase activity